jgi:hypothetical protein
VEGYFHTTLRGTIRSTAAEGKTYVVLYSYRLCPRAAWVVGRVRARRSCNILLRRCCRRRVRACDISSSAVFAVFLRGGSDLLIGAQSVRRGD